MISAVGLTTAASCGGEPTAREPLPVDAAQPDVTSTIDGSSEPPRQGPRWPAAEPLPTEFDLPPFINMPAPNHIVVTWQTTDVIESRLHLGTSRAYSIVVEPTVDERLATADLGVLEPATEYFFEVEIVGTSASRKGVFLTPGSAEWRFMHLAEFHAPSGSPSVALFTEAIEQFQPHVIVESGDMLDSGVPLEFWRDYFRTSAPWISNTIILPVGSNHVFGYFGPGLLKYYYSLPNNERWYTTRFSDVEFFTLDSTYGPLTPDLEILEPDWVASESALTVDGQDDPRLVVGAWHYPACSTHMKWRPEQREWVMTNFIDTFAANGGIDLILTGHDKYYERSLIDGTIPHVQTSAGRVDPDTEGDNHPRCTPQATNIESQSLLFATVDEAGISASAVDPSGAVLDTFRVAPR